MDTWDPADELSVPPEMAAAVGGHPLLAQILLRRGLTDLQDMVGFIDPDKYQPAEPQDLPDMERALALLVDAFRANKRICIWGDFDVDGLTATATLVESLAQAGCDTFYYIPHRREGHGLNAEGLEWVRQQGGEVLVTCDCGVTDSAEIELAGQMGMEVVITDHHELPPILPQVPVLNPHRLAQGHALSYLCGVGVAHVLLQALSKEIPALLLPALDLFFLGSIADRAPLKGENRFLLQRGWPQLAYHPRPGIAALLRLAQAYPSELLDTDIVAYTLAPRLNAAGRLAHARTAVELLLSQDADRAMKRAAELELLNDKRRMLGRQVEAEAEALLQRQPSITEEPALVLMGKDWHAGVIGQVATVLAERYGKPTVILSTSEGEPARASVRSVAGVHVQQVLEKHQDLLLNFGGHAMAAGFAIDPDKLPTFRSAFHKSVGEMLEEGIGEEDMVVQGPLGLAEIDADLVRDIYRLAPFGAGNAMPVFDCGQVHLVNVESLGNSNRHARMVVEDGEGNKVPAIWWNRAPADVPREAVDVAFVLRLDEYRGRVQARLDVRRVRPQTKIVIETPPQELPFQVEDLRRGEERLKVLASLGGQVQIWAEGDDAKEVEAGKPRSQLQAAKTLVIWSAPPGPQEMALVLDKVAPDCVYLLTRGQQDESPTDFLRVLGGLAKAAMARRQGQVRLLELAQRLGHREETVLRGLDYLAASGRLRYRVFDDRIYIESGGEESGQSGGEALKSLLLETAAYRRFFNQAEPDKIFQLGTSTSA